MDERGRIMQRREHEQDLRELSVQRREREVNDAERRADRREWESDQRETLADEREETANQRDRAADRREQEAHDQGLLPGSDDAQQDRAAERAARVRAGVDREWERSRRDHAADGAPRPAIDDRFKGDLTSLADEPIRQAQAP